MEDEDFEDFSSAVEDMEDEGTGERPVHTVNIYQYQAELMAYLSEVENAHIEQMRRLGYSHYPPDLREDILLHIKETIDIYHEFINELNNTYSSLSTSFSRSGRQPRHPRQVDMRRRLIKRSYRRAMRELAEEDN